MSELKCPVCGNPLCDCSLCKNTLNALNKAVCNTCNNVVVLSEAIARQEKGARVFV